MKLQLGIAASLIFLLSACDKVKVENKAVETKVVKYADKKNETAFVPFHVYLDKGTKENHYIPSGFMPDGQCVKMDEGWVGGCHAGQSCIKIIYDVQCSRDGANWSGIYWLNPANNWGKRKGGYNLTGATKLTFWARGEKGGEQIQEFTVGGISGDYPDTDMAVMGPVILSNEWKKYTIDLSGKDLTSIIGGFSWTTSTEVNSEIVVFYLDDIRFE
ncbi:MAG: hypothetical protein HQL25_04160 [Candidatus Omnitrophica bacterium]|nr:hypothetical protein [Candidatus Omnitrophota bacterium]